MPIPTTTPNLFALLQPKSKDGKKRTTLYIGKDCKPELAKVICEVIGYLPTKSNILDESGTRIFEYTLLEVDRLKRFIASSVELTTLYSEFCYKENPNRL
jgi:hypothetical protein